MEFFYDVLNEYIEKTQLTPGRLSKLTNISRQTIASWRQGRVKRPRLAEDILDIAKAMRLTAAETDRLLLSADYDSLDRLRKRAEEQQNETLHSFLAFWSSEKKSVAPPAPIPQKTPFQAPSKIGDFVGRQSEIEQISQQLKTGGAICVLQGMGGVGKSTLANHLAYVLRTDFSDGVLWATLKDEPLDDDQSMTILRDFAKAYGVDVKDDLDVESRSRTVRGLLSSKNALIVFDNVYQTEDVRPLLPSADGNCSVLITTRNQRLLQDRAHTYDVNSFSHEDGLTLLKKIIKDSRVDNEKESALEVIDFVGGLPLALRIIGSAIAEIDTITLKEYSDLLKDEFSRLEYLEDWEDLSKNVRASFELSYQRLNSKQQDLLNQIAAFVGRDFSEDAILALASHLNPALVKLKYLSRFKSLSLIEFQIKVDDTAESPKKAQPYQARYRFHPLLRTFVREKLGEPQEALHKRLAEYYAGYTQEYGRDTYRALDLDWENIEAAVNWSHENEWNDTLVQLTQGATQLNLGNAGFLDAYGHWRKGLEWLAWCLNAPVTAENERLSALCYLKQGTFAFHLSDLELAQEALHQSLEALNEPMDEESAIYHAYVCDILSQLDATKGIEYALDWSERAIEQLNPFDSDDATHLRGYMLVRRSSIWGKAGDINAAQNTVEQGLALLPEHSTAARVSAYTSLGAVAYFKNDHDEAKKYWELATIDAEKLGDNRRLADLQQNLGTIYSHKGDFAQSTHYYEQAMALYIQIGYVRGECSALGNLSHDMRIIGEVSKANDHLESAIPKARKAQTEEEIYLLINRIHLQIYTENLSTVEEDIERASLLSHQRRSERSTGIIMFAKAEIALLENDFEKAKTFIDQALSVNLDAEAEGVSLRIQGDILDALNQPNNALSAYEKSVYLLKPVSRFEYWRTQVAFAHLQSKTAKDAEGKTEENSSPTTILEEALDAFEEMNAVREIIKTKEILTTIQNDS